MIVELSDEAERELEAIGDYIAQDDVERAISFVRELRDACEALADMPLRFPLVPRYETFGIRKRVCGHYLILYRVEDARVFILHIVHGAMDYPQNLL